MNALRTALLVAVVALVGCNWAAEPTSSPEVHRVHKPIALPDSGIEPPAEILIADMPEVPKEIRGPSPPIDAASP